MVLSDIPSSLTKLDQTDPGDDLIVRSILRDPARRDVGPLGVREQELIQCRAVSDEHVAVEAVDGRTVTVSRVDARRIHVERIGRFGKLL